MRYEIPKYYLEKLEKLIKSLQKKTDVKFEVFEDEIALRVFELEGVKYRYRVVPVELELDYKLGDYTLVAQLEHTDKGNIINQINQEFVVPKSYRDVPCRCEHCQTTRNRKNTYLLVDANGNYKQVGKNCLNEYTGIDAEYIIGKVSSIEFLLQPIFSEPDDEFLEFLRNSQSRYCDIKECANQMVQVLNDYGYDKNKDLLDLCSSYKYNKELEPRVNELLNVVNTDWYNDDSNYCYNVKMILSDDYMETRHLRLLLSYLYSAMNYLGKEDIKNEYLGNIGDRITFEVKDFRVLFVNRPEYYEYRPITYTYRIVTKDNHIVLWTTDKELKDYKIKSIKATIKNLKEYKGEKQTVVTRGTIEEVKEPIDETKTADYGFKQFLDFVDSEEVDWDKFQQEYKG